MVQQTIRVKRPKDRLLLLCRTCLFLILLLIFLRPVLFFDNPVPGQPLPKNLVIIIDRSASMSWYEGGRSRFQAACNEAAVLLDTLSSRDVANIVWIDREPDSVFPEMGSNIPYLKERLREARCTNQYGNSEQAINLALSQLNTRTGDREVCIISDFQSTQWENIPFKIPDDITVSTLWPVRETAENGAVLSIRTEPVSPLSGEITQVLVSVGNFSDTPRNRNVILTIDEKRVTKQVQIPAWAHGAVVVEHIFSNHGRINVNARLEEDAFGIDDWRAAIVHVRDALHVGVVGEDPYTSPVFARVLEALPWVSATEMKFPLPEETSVYDVIVLYGWKGENPHLFKTLREKGIPLIVFPAPELQLASISRLLGKENVSGKEAVVLETVEPAMGLTVSDKNHKAFSLFRTGEFGDPSQASFKKRFRMDNGVLPGNVLLSFDDGKPALVECPGASTVMFWFAPLTSECGNWAAQAAFLPFAGELIGALKGSKKIRIPDTALPGEVLSFRIPPTFDEWKLYDEADAVFPVTRLDSVTDGIHFVSEPIRKPGVYRLCSKDHCTSVQVVNFSTNESDLRVNQPPVITQQGGYRVKHAEELTAAKEGTSLWKILIWLALVVTGVESLLVYLLDKDERKLAKGNP